MKRIMAAMFASLAITSALAGQESPDMPTAEMRIRQVARDRRPEMEATARAFVYHIAHDRIGAADGPIGVPALDQLKAANVEAYWMEVGQLAVQFDMFQKVFARDSVRARSMAAMFGTEFEARILQRAWRSASETERRSIRTRLEALMNRHFDAEDQLRVLELRDIERRLADARTESERRRQRRAELVRWSVDDIIHGAQRPD